MGKIYGKTEGTDPKPKKKKNEHNRLRNIIVNFRVSPKEKAVLDARIDATGMRKQDYYRQSCMFQKILVRGNIRSLSAIRDAVRDIAIKIEHNPDLTALDSTDAERLKTVLEMMCYLFGEGGSDV